MSLREDYQKAGIEITEQQEEKILELDLQFHNSGIPDFKENLLNLLVVMKYDKDFLRRLQETG